MAISFKKPPKTAGEQFAEHLGAPVSEVAVKPAVGTVSVSLKQAKSQEEHVIKDEQHTLNKGVIAPKDQMCMVMAGGSHTVNLGNYESAKVSVSVTIPCVKDDLDATYEFATNWVSEKIGEAVQQAKG